MLFVIPSVSDLILAVVAGLFQILLSIPMNYIFRMWTYESAFQGMSKIHRKKICKEHSWMEKVWLLFTLSYKNPGKTKRRIILCYLYYLITLISIMLLILRSFWHALFDLSAKIGFWWLCIIVVISVVYLIKARNKK